MAESTRQEAQQRRSEGRERRRSMLTEPFERLSDAASGSGDGPTSEVRETVKRAALTAAVAAAVGAAAGVAKTLLDRRNEGGVEKERDDESEPQGRAADAGEDDRQEGRAEAVDDEEDDEPEGRAELADDEDDEPEGRAELADDEEDDDPEGRAELADDDEDEDDRQEGRAEAAQQDEDDEDESEQQQGRAERVAASGEQDDDGENERASVDDADSEPATIVPKARRALEELLGREAESVSGFERENSHWKVNLEVVELRRIPDSSDVLGSYELVLDDDGNVARMSRTRRYQRSEVESG
jgi:hypothetical protein